MQSLEEARKNSRQRIEAAGKALKDARKTGNTDLIRSAQKQFDAAMANLIM